MDNDYRTDPEFENRFFKRMFDFYITLGLLIGLLYFCYVIFSPFRSMMIWALILAVIFYPLHQKISNGIRGKQGIASFIVVLLGIIIVVIPSGIIAGSLGDSLHSLVMSFRNNTIHIPEPMTSVRDIPVIGVKIFEVWSLAFNDLTALIQRMQPAIGEVAKSMLEGVASLGGDIIKFFFSFIIAGIIMAYGKSGEETAGAISKRIVGPEKGEGFVRLSVATIRAVALGVIGIACIQAIILGLGFIFAGIPMAGYTRNSCSNIRNRTGAGNDSYIACHYLYMDERRLRNCRGSRIYCYAGDWRYGGQCSEAFNDRSRC